MTVIRLISFGLSLCILILIIDLVRRGKLTFKYAFGWIAISVSGIFFSIFNHLLFNLSMALGFVLPSNFIFFTLLCFFIFLSLFLTIFLCQQNNRNDRIAQKLGILELEINQIKDNKK